jgi:hypothetical protein
MQMKQPCKSPEILLDLFSLFGIKTPKGAKSDAIVPESTRSPLALFLKRLLITASIRWRLHGT